MARSGRPQVSSASAFNELGAIMTEMLNQDSRPARAARASPVRVGCTGRSRHSGPGSSRSACRSPTSSMSQSASATARRAESKFILGQCWARRASADGVNHIFLGPQEGDPAAMLISLLHELIHAADDCASGHKGTFAEAATRLGFEGPMTQTPPGLELTAEVITLAEALGPFPHAKLNPTMAEVPVPVPPGGGPAPEPGGKIHSGPGKQGTRMIKLTAAGCCGYTVRTTQQMAGAGQPACPHGQPMHED